MMTIVTCLLSRIKGWRRHGVLFALVMPLAMTLPAGAEEPSDPAGHYELVVERYGQSASTNTSRLIAAIPMPEGEGWCVKWRHSVARFLVLDCYRNVAGQMVLERSHQPDFAAGLGHTPGRGVQVSDGEGGYWINRIDEPVPGNGYVLRVGAMRVDHRLIWPRQRATETFSISKHAAGERVIIRLQRTDQSPCVVRSRKS